MPINLSALYHFAGLMAQNGESGLATEDSGLFTVVAETACLDLDGDQNLACGNPSICLPGDIAGCDCNDDNDTIHSGADDICNEIDDDCDGEADNDEAFQLTYCPDADGDGIGAENPTETTCDPQPGWITDCRDCDDTQDSVHPDVSSDACDWVDNDCDD